LKCPERDEKIATCPWYQLKTFVIEGKYAEWEGYRCPRRPLTHSVDVGFSAHVRSALSPPPTNCAAASTGACLKVGNVDDDCCAACYEGSCAPGYTYAGQFRFDGEMLSSTYPDFDPHCGDEHSCGNTCCVPSDEWDSARAAAFCRKNGEGIHDSHGILRYCCPGLEATWEDRDPADPLIGKWPTWQVCRPGDSNGTAPVAVGEDVRAALSPPSLPPSDEWDSVRVADVCRKEGEDIYDSYGILHPCCPGLEVTSEDRDPSDPYIDKWPQKDVCRPGAAVSD